MRVLDVFLKIVTRLTWGMSAVGMVGLVALSASIVADVFMRYFLNAPITGVRDMLSLFIAVVMGLMMPVLLMKEGNIAVHFIEVVVGKRIGAVLTLLANIVTAVLFVLIGNEVWKAARYLQVNNEVTQVLGVPLGPWWMLVAVMFFFSALAALVPITNGIRLIVNPAGQAPAEGAA